MELIDRRKLVSDFWKGVEDAIILSYEDTDELMENAPTVDAVEVVHGQWVDEFDGKYANPKYICSQCTLKALYKQKMDVLGNWQTVQALTDYCPNCGAKMDGDGNG